MIIEGEARPTPVEPEAPLSDALRELIRVSKSAGMNAASDFGYLPSHQQADEEEISEAVESVHRAIGIGPVTLEEHEAIRSAARPTPVEPEARPEPLVIEPWRELLEAWLHSGGMDRDELGRLITSTERSLGQSEVGYHAIDPEVEPDGLPLDVRPQVARFARLMERVLRDNDHKGGWQDCKPDWLLMRLRQEVAELDSAMASGTVPHTGVDGRTGDVPADPIREAADVANFAMMIADVLGAPSEDEQPR